ncbi:MAG TPA: protoporphyrinogen oxidase [Acidimicrobiales bacterium]
MSRASVVIVGGGIAGLSAAWELTGAKDGPDDNSPRVEIIEADNRVGGVLRTTTFAGRTIDLGADGFLARRPEVVELIGELGCSNELEAIDASGASIWLRGSLNELPTGLVLGIPISSGQLAEVKGLSLRARFDAARDQRVPVHMNVGDDATIGDIVRTKLGRELAYQFIEPMVGGIQAGRIDQLSAKSVFPALLAAAQKGGSLMKALRSATASAPEATGPIFNSLIDGVGSLPLEVAERLRARDVVVRTGVAVTALRRTPSGNYPWEVDTSTTTTPADVVVLATPAPTVARLLGSLDPALERLSSIPSAGAAIITLSVPRNAITLSAAGTGVLVPLGTPWTGEGSMMVTALTFLDRKWAHLRLDDDVLLRAHVGRIDDERWSQLSDDELTERVANEMRVLLPRFGNDFSSVVQRWPAALPQYYLGHDTMVTNARAAAATIRVALCGSAYDGVGIPASIGSGRRAGREARDMVRDVAH